jgi:hypothetical protein
MARLLGRSRSRLRPRSFGALNLRAAVGRICPRLLPHASALGRRRRSRFRTRRGLGAVFRSRRRFYPGRRSRGLRPVFRTHRLLGHRAWSFGAAVGRIRALLLRSRLRLFRPVRWRARNFPAGTVVPRSRLTGCALAASGRRRRVLLYSRLRNHPAPFRRRRVIGDARASAP